jgi:hypothetical protein
VAQDNGSTGRGEIRAAESLRYVSRGYMTNTSLRERFGIEPQNSAAASRYIKEAVEQGVIGPYDELAGCKYMKYVPPLDIMLAWTTLFDAISQRATPAYPGPSISPTKTIA